MKHTKISLISLILVFCFMVPLFGQQYDGIGVGLDKLAQSTMNFLQVGVVPRACGLADAYMAVGKGAESIFYNPAALPEIDGRVQAFVSNTQWIADINYLAGAAAINLDELGAFGVSFLVVDYGDIIGTRLLDYSALNDNPLGYIETGMVDNVGAYAFGLSYGRRISEKFLMGGTVRYVGQQLGSVITETGESKNSVNKLVFDLGVKYYAGFKGFRFGMAIRNFATAVKFQEISTQLPLTFALGGAIDLMEIIQPEMLDDHNLLCTIEFVHPNNFTERLNMGLEYTLMNLVAVRCGYSGNHDVLGFNAGIGVTPQIAGKMINIDYSFSSSIDYFNDINRISVGFSF